MPSWKDINGRIAAARASRDPIAALEALFEDTRDGHVAMALGRAHQASGQPNDAGRWYSEAERRYPLQSYKEQARRARSGLATSSIRRTSPPVKQQADTTLHVISCSQNKAWQDGAVTERYLRAKEAYRGGEITEWVRNPESLTARWLILSAKYGFIEPDHPISNYDVTFNDSTTGPITDSSLQGQVDHQTRWDDGIHLRSFKRVVVHGSGAYLKKTRDAFASTGAKVLAAKNVGQKATSPAQLTCSAERAAVLGRALRALPIGLFERFDDEEPDLPVRKALARLKHPWGVLGALAFGLTDYQLGTGGATVYWQTIANLLPRRNTASSRDLLAFIERLVREPVSSRLANQKVERIRRLLDSDFALWCSQHDMEFLGKNAALLWSRLSGVMQRDRNAKTIAFAMKCFDLLHRTKVGRYASFTDVPIVADLRVKRISLSSGIVQHPGTDVVAAMERYSEVTAEDHPTLLEAWRSVQQAAGGLSLFRIDSLAWQLAAPLYQLRSNKATATQSLSGALVRFGANAATANRIASELTSALP